MTKVTRSTFKSFVKNNREKLLVKVHSEFDGMTDCVESIEDEFTPAVPANFPENTLGIAGIWLCGPGRDRYHEFDKDGLKGIEVYNSCGHFSVAVKK
jgi:hypothetical protein